MTKREHAKAKRKKVSRRNAAAKALALPQYRQRRVPSKRKVAPLYADLRELLWVETY